MQDRLEVVAFDVDLASLITLRQAFPGWQIAAVTGATALSLHRDWNPAKADLLLVGAREDVGESLHLCRGLRGQAGRAHTPLFVLIAPGRAGQAGLESAAAGAGANGCLVQAETLSSALACALAATRPVDQWREGGES